MCALGTKLVSASRWRATVPPANDGRIRPTSSIDGVRGPVKGIETLRQPDLDRRPASRRAPAITSAGGQRARPQYPAGTGGRARRRTTHRTGGPRKAEPTVSSEGRVGRVRVALESRRCRRFPLAVSPSRSTRGHRQRRLPADNQNHVCARAASSAQDSSTASSANHASTGQYASASDRLAATAGLGPGPTETTPERSLDGSLVVPRRPPLSAGTTCRLGAETRRPSPGMLPVERVAPHPLGSEQNRWAVLRGTRQHGHVLRVSADSCPPSERRRGARLIRRRAVCRGWPKRTTARLKTAYQHRE